ncbi:unnamed protein product, partial [Darwinula stevensoni]
MAALFKLVRSHLNCTPIKHYHHLPVLLGLRGVLRNAHFLAPCTVLQNVQRQLRTSSFLNVVGSPLKMPSLSPTMNEGTIVKWLKKEGDPVQPGDVLCEIQTDKAVVAFEVEEEGILAKILELAFLLYVVFLLYQLSNGNCMDLDTQVKEDTKDVKVGTLIALMVGEGEDWKKVEIPVGAGVSIKSEKKEEMEKHEGVALKSDANLAPGAKPEPKMMGPSVRGLLEQYGLKASEVPASGPHGLPLKGDVLAYIKKKGLIPKVTLPKDDGRMQERARIEEVSLKQPLPDLRGDSAKSPTKALFEDIDLSNMRKTIAKRLSQSKVCQLEIQLGTTIAHAYETVECDIDAILNTRKKLKESGINVSVNDFLIKAVAETLNRFPQVNVIWQGEQLVTSRTVDVSVAVATEEGLITPIIFNANQRSMEDISREMKILADKAKQRRLQPQEFIGGSFTISNLGMFGITEFTAIINPPQCGILAVGTGRRCIGADMKVKTLMSVTMSYDNVAIADDMAAEFLDSLRVTLECPQKRAKTSRSERKEGENDDREFAAIESKILQDISKVSSSDESDQEEFIHKFDFHCKPKMEAVTCDWAGESIDGKLSDSDDENDNDSTSNSPNVRPTISDSKVESTQEQDSEEQEESGGLERLDVSQILALGEGLGLKSESTMNSDESGESDLEEVAGIPMKEEVEASSSIEVTIPIEGRQRKRKGFDMEAYIKRKIARVKREIQLLVHKVHILCLIAHMQHLNSLVNDTDLLGLAISVIPSTSYPKKHADLKYLEMLLKWFREKFPILESDEKCLNSGKDLPRLVRVFQEHNIRNPNDLVLVFVAVVRSVGLDCRLIMSLTPLPLKPPSESSGTPLLSAENRSQEKSKKKEDKPNPTYAKMDRVRANIKSKDPTQPSASKDTFESPRLSKKSAQVQPQLSSSKKTSRKSAALKTEKDFVEIKSVSPGNSISKISTSPEKRVTSMENLHKSTKGSRKKQEGRTTLKEVSADQKRKSLRVKEQKNYDESASDKPKRGGKWKSDGSLAPVQGKKSRIKSGDDDDDDFEPEILKIKKVTTPRVDPKKRKVLSSDEETPKLKKNKTEKGKRKGKGQDLWVEVYLEAEEAWISVDVVHGNIHCIQELEGRATRPMWYVIGIKNDGGMKDLTPRYSSRFLSQTRKARVDEHWLKASLQPFLEKRTPRSKKEDDELDTKLMETPLPTTLAEYKNHPLYALKRHLLKFEAIYPEDAPPLGFFRREPVYARECIHTLRSRETWLKEARVVKRGETPYKVVKARPKYDRLSGEVLKDQPLEVFGMWQTEDYEPPVAENGKVPRNPYGNVELFKPSMLPIGTVQLKMPGLNSVAKKLGIDCAPAMIGWDYHGGGCHPMYDGFIVCQEFKDVLVDAWNQEQEEAERREEEKREKRIYGNWKRLIKGLLIRERLEEKYQFGCTATKEQKPAADADKKRKKK